MEYRLCLSSCGHKMRPITFDASCDVVAKKVAEGKQQQQQKSQAGGTSGIVSLLRIDVQEETTRII